MTLKDLPQAAKQSFPLCAKNLYDAVKASTTCATRDDGSSSCT